MTALVLPLLRCHPRPQWDTRPKGRMALDLPCCPIPAVATPQLLQAAPGSPDPTRAESANPSSLCLHRHCPNRLGELALQVSAE